MILANFIDFLLFYILTRIILDYVQL